MPTDTSPFKKANSEKESMAGPETPKGPETQVKAQDPEVAVNQGEAAPKKEKASPSKGERQEVIPDDSNGGESTTEPSAERKPSPTRQRDQATLDKYPQARGPPLTRESNDVGGAIAGETQVTFDPDDDTRFGAPANPQIGAKAPEAKKREPVRTTSDLDGEGGASDAEGIQRPRAYDVNRREGQTKLGEFTVQGKDAQKDAELRQHDIDVRNSQRNRPAAPPKEQQGLREEDNITGLNREAAEREKERTRQKMIEWQEQARQRAAQQNTEETPPSGPTSVEDAMPGSEDREAPERPDKYEVGQGETYDDYKLRNQKSRLGYWMGTFGDVGASTAGAAGRAAEGFGRGYKAMSELAGNAIANLGNGGTPMTLASDGVAALGEGIASVYDGIVGKKKMIQNPDGTYREGTELESDIRDTHTPEYYHERDDAMMAERYINGRFSKIVEEVSRGKDVTQLSDDDIRRVYFDIEDYLRPELERIYQKEKNGIKLTMADQAYRDAYKGIAEAWSDYSNGIRRYRAERRGDLDASKQLAEEQKAGYEAQLAALQGDADSGEGAGAAGGAETARRGTGGAAGANTNTNNINVNTGGNKQQVKQENNQNQQVNIFFNWGGGGPDDPDRSPIPVRGFKGDDGSIYVDMGHGRGTKKVIDEDGKPTVPDIVDVKDIDEEFAEEFEEEGEDEVPAQEVSEEGAKDQDNDVLPDDTSEQEEVAPGNEDKAGGEQPAVDPNYKRQVSSTKDGDGEVLGRADGKGYSFMDRRGNVTELPPGADVEPPAEFKGNNFIYALDGKTFGEILHTKDTNGGRSEIVQVDMNGKIADEVYIRDNLDWAKNHQSYINPIALNRILGAEKEIDANLAPFLDDGLVPQGADRNVPTENYWNSQVKFDYSVLDPNDSTVREYYGTLDLNGRKYKVRVNRSGLINDPGFLRAMGPEWAYNHRAKVQRNGKKTRDGKDAWNQSGLVDLFAAQNVFPELGSKWTEALEDYQRVTGRPMYDVNGRVPFPKGRRSSAGVPPNPEKGAAGQDLAAEVPTTDAWGNKIADPDAYMKMGDNWYPSIGGSPLGYIGTGGTSERYSYFPRKTYHNAVKEFLANPKDKVAHANAMKALITWAYADSLGYPSYSKKFKKLAQEMYKDAFGAEPKVDERVEKWLEKQQKSGLTPYKVINPEIMPAKTPEKEPKKEKEPENSEKKDYHIGEFGLDKRGFKTLNDYIDAFASPGKGIFDKTYKIVEGRNPEENVKDYNELQRAMNAIQKTIKNLSPQDILLDPEYEETLQSIELFEPKRRAIMRHIKENPEKYNKWKLNNNGTYVQHKGPTFGEYRKEGEDTANPPGIDLNPKGLSNPAKLLPDEVKWKAHEVTFETWLNQVAQYNKMYAMNNALAEKDYRLLGGKP